MRLDGDEKSKMKLNAAKMTELGVGENGIYILETIQCYEYGIEGISDGIVMIKVELFELIGSDGG